MMIADNFQRTMGLMVLPRVAMAQCPDTILTDTASDQRRNECSRTHNQRGHDPRRQRRSAVQTAAVGVRNKRVQTVFNTHYHLENTGGNETLGQAGAKIIAHESTREWMATPHWVPAEDRYEKPRPKAAQPTETFYTSGSLKAGVRTDRLRLPD